MRGMEDSGPIWWHQMSEPRMSGHHGYRTGAMRQDLPLRTDETAEAKPVATSLRLAWPNESTEEDVTPQPQSPQRAVPRRATIATMTAATATTDAQKAFDRTAPTAVVPPRTTASLPTISPQTTRAALIDDAASPGPPVLYEDPWLVWANETGVSLPGTDTTYAWSVSAGSTPLQMTPPPFPMTGRVSEEPQDEASRGDATPGSADLVLVPTRDAVAESRPIHVRHRPPVSPEPGAPQALKPCLTCRKRHVKCDKVMPACYRCRKFRRKCLGYAPRALPFARDDSSDAEGQEVGEKKRRGRTASTGADGVLTVVSRTQSRASSVSAATQTPSPRIALDPFRLGFRLKQVMDYYDKYSCHLITLYDSIDGEEVNPCRQFLAMVPVSPLIRNMILTVASHHRAQCISPSSPVLPHDAIPETAEADMYQHKADALTSFIRGIQEEDASDTMLAALVLIMWIGLFDKELGMWKTHLRAMRELLRKRGIQNSSMSETALPWWPQPPSIYQQCFEEIYVVVSVFGATTCREKEDPMSLFPPLVLSMICRRAERRTWTGCPGAVLEILALVNRLTTNISIHEASPSSSPFLNSTPEPPSPRQQLPPCSGTVDAVFARLADFSPRAYADGFAGERANREARYHAAAAYKAAVYIYAQHALGTWRDHGDELREAVASAVDHMVQVPIVNTHFKGLIWPILAVGLGAGGDGLEDARACVLWLLEAQYREHRSWRFEHGRLLFERVWARPPEVAAERSWLHDVYEFADGVVFV